MRIQIIIVLAALIAAAAKAALQLVKKQDQKNGLELNERSYSPGGILRLLFARKDRRISIETQPETAVLLQEDAKAERQFYLLNGISCALIAGSGIFAYFLGCTIMPFLLCLGLMAHYMIRKKDISMTFSLAVSVIVMIIGVVFRAYVVAALLLCHIPAVVSRILMKKTR